MSIGVSPPIPAREQPAVEKGFLARPRQLVGQLTGPGVATAPARLGRSSNESRKPDRGGKDATPNVMSPFAWNFARF
jgi:hypothetical protein